MTEISISIDDARWDSLAGLEPALESAARAALAAGLADGGDGADISLALSDDDAIQALNRDYRGKDQPTNVLSFPAYDSAEEIADALKAARGGGPPALLGDVILAYDTVAREALDQGKPFIDHARHLVVHGVLHLIGFDHETDAEADIMEELERRILAGLGVPDPYLNDLKFADIVEDEP